MILFQTKNIIISISIIILSANVGFAQDLPLIGEVFDFEVGDEFHFEPISYEQVVFRYKVIDVDYSLNGDSVIYTYSYDGYTYSWNSEESIIEYDFFSDIVIREYEKLDSSMFYYSTLFEFDTISYQGAQYCDQQIIGAFYDQTFFETVTEHKEWGIGLGSTFWEYINVADFAFNGFEMFYYNKNGIGCGTPDDILLQVTEHMKLNISIYPNPCSNNLMIDSPYFEKTEIQFIDLNGKILLSTKLTRGENNIDVSNLPDGLIIYQLREEENSILKEFGKFIKQ